MNISINLECADIGTCYGVLMGIMMGLDVERSRQKLTLSDAFTESVIFSDAACYGGYQVVVLIPDSGE